MIGFSLLRRAATLGAVIVLSGACAPSSADAEEPLLAALAGSAADVRFEDARFFPSSDPHVGTWTAYTVSSSGEGPTGLLLVNHGEDDAVVAIAVDTQTVAPRIVAASSREHAAAAAVALAEDLASFADAEEPASPQGTRPRGLVDGIGLTTTKRLLAKAARAIGTTGRELEEAVRRYSGEDHYERLNTFLREGVAPEPWTKKGLREEVRTLRAAVAATPPFPAEVHRWYRIGMHSRKGVQLADLEAFLSQLEPGAVFRDRAFLSTTVRTVPPEGLFWFSTFRFDIRGVSGRDISGLSVYGPEKELLFLPGTRFRVLSVHGTFARAPKLTNPEATRPSAEHWWGFVRAVKAYFPDATKASVAKEVAAGKEPNLVVRLEEIP